MISKFIRLEVCRDIAFGFSFSWLGLRVGGHCWLGLRVGGHCLEWLAVGLSRFLIYLALSPHLIIWSCEAVCPYGSRVCHGLPNRLWVAWVSRFKCRYLDTQLWQWYCFLNNWHDTLSEAVGGNQILGVHLYNFANNSIGIQIFMKYRLFHCTAIWNGVFPCVAHGRWLEHEPSWLWLFFFLLLLFMSYKTCLNRVRYIYRYETCLNHVRYIYRYKTCPNCVKVYL